MNLKNDLGNELGYEPGYELWKELWGELWDEFGKEALLYVGMELVMVVILKKLNLI